MAWDCSTSVLVMVSDITGRLVVFSVDSVSMMVVILTVSVGVVRDRE